MICFCVFPLRMPELDFDRKNTLYATHGLHAFAAKCPPQLARYAIRYYSSRGNTVLDPMAGSGTTLVQARLMGRSAIGVEIDPVARLIAKVKATPVCASAIDSAEKEIVRRLEAELPKKADDTSELPNFRNRDYWFSPEVSRVLMALSKAIAETAMPSEVRDFFWVALSSVILARNSVANARDIIHSRHHHIDHAEPPNVIQRFGRRVKKMRSQVREFTDLCTRQPSGRAAIIGGDARQIPLPDQSIDLVFTSPPYATALDYPRAHFLSVPWLGPALGVEVDAYLSRGAHYIGAERGKKPDPEDSLETLKSLPVTHATLRSLLVAARPQASIIAKYFLDMRSVLKETQRVLKTGSYLVLVVCPSHIRKVQIPTNRLLAEIAEAVGLEAKAEHVRTISERRRVLPYVDGDLRKRMDTEYVLIFEKG